MERDNNNDSVASSTSGSELDSSLPQAVIQPELSVELGRPVSTPNRSLGDLLLQAAQAKDARAASSLVNGYPNAVWGNIFKQLTADEQIWVAEAVRAGDRSRTRDDDWI